MKRRQPMRTDNLPDDVLLWYFVKLAEKEATHE